MRRFFTRAIRHGLAILCAVILGAFAFELLHISVFSKFGSPHAICYLADPKMIWLHVVSDSLIGVAYVSISLTLSYLVFKASKDIPFHSVLLAFGLFIVSCGFTHFMEVLVIWQPLYWLSGYVKVVTAAASVATAIALFPLVPKVFALISSVKKTEARRKQIEVLNGELEAFTSTVAHDLRAPLRAVAGLSLALKEDYADRLDATGVDYTNRIIASAQRMDRLIIDLLDYSRISNDKVDLKPVELAAVIAEAQTALADEIKTRQATVITSATGTVLASHTLLVQVVTNLIGNAVKFVAPGTRPQVTISAELNETFVRLKVSDNGIGIAPEHQDRIFRIFERINPAYDGTGIGLAIVEKAARRMAARVAVQSAPGQGSTFSIELPAASNGH